MTSGQSRNNEKQYQVIWFHGNKSIEFVKQLKVQSKLFWDGKIIIFWELTDYRFVYSKLFLEEGQGIGDFDNKMLS